MTHVRTAFPGKDPNRVTRSLSCLRRPHAFATVMNFYPLARVDLF
jgi:hypothetical protein